MNNLHVHPFFPLVVGIFLTIFVIIYLQFLIYNELASRFNLMMLTYSDLIYCNLFLFMVMFSSISFISLITYVFGTKEGKDATK